MWERGNWPGWYVQASSPMLCFVNNDYVISEIIYSNCQPSRRSLFGQCCKSSMLIEPAQKAVGIIKVSMACLLSQPQEEENKLKNVCCHGCCVSQRKKVSAAPMALQSSSSLTHTHSTLQRTVCTVRYSKTVKGHTIQISNTIGVVNRIPRR